MDRPAISSAAIAADLDKDGDLDIVINNINEVSIHISKQYTQRKQASLYPNTD